MDQPIAVAPTLLRTRLAVQMFLQFATWGVWVPVLGNHLAGIGIAPERIGLIYATGPLALMLAPLLAGQIADRWFATERFLALSYVAAAALFELLAQSTGFHAIWWLALAAMLCFGPTLGLANALCFHHLRDAERDFPLVRVWGTIGWIAANWALAGWMDASHRPVGDCLHFAAGFALLNGCYVLTLPHTPPRGGAGARFPLATAMGMLKDPSFAVFALLAFAILACATFYYNFTGLFIERGLGLSAQNVSRVMSIGQAMEIATMFVLPFALRRLGFKATIAIGIAAWTLRFGIFALGTPAALVIAAQALHGLCFAFAIAASMLYVERISSPENRGTMQSLLAFITYGLGMEVGSLLAAGTMGAVTAPSGAVDWRSLWLVPASGCAVLLVLFAIGFRDRSRAPADAVRERLQ